MVLFMGFGLFISLHSASSAPAFGGAGGGAPEAVAPAKEDCIEFFKTLEFPYNSEQFKKKEKKLRKQWNHIISEKKVFQLAPNILIFFILRVMLAKPAEYPGEQFLCERINKIARDPMYPADQRALLSADRIAMKLYEGSNYPDLSATLKDSIANMIITKLVPLNDIVPYDEIVTIPGELTEAPKPNIMVDEFFGNFIAGTDVAEGRKGRPMKARHDRFDKILNHTDNVRYVIPGLCVLLQFSSKEQPVMVKSKHKAKSNKGVVQESQLSGDIKFLCNAINTFVMDTSKPFSNRALLSADCAKNYVARVFSAGNPEEITAMCTIIDAKLTALKDIAQD